MKYKDSFWNYYFMNALRSILKNFKTEMLNYWWCCDCQKYHSPRVKDYAIRNKEGYKCYFTCIEQKEIEYDREDIITYTILTKED